jgi:AbrB family looped-hinge helix DNA binding protein
LQKPVKFEVSILKTGSSLRITIPKEIARYLGLAKGDKVSVYANDHRMITEKGEA